MNSDLSLDFLRVVEQAAIACSHTMGQGDADKSDHAAVEAMRESLDTVMIDGTIVIGEGERDEAPMLYIGEKVGLGAKGKFPWGMMPTVDIAVDPLEGTNLCSPRRARAGCCTRRICTWRSWSSGPARRTSSAWTRLPPPTSRRSRSRSAA